jgi:hypothetical protein
VLSNKVPAFADTSRDSCTAQGRHKRDTVGFFNIDWPFLVVGYNCPYISAGNSTDSAVTIVSLKQ